MRWFFGRPPGLLPLGETTFRYRGVHDFQLHRNGRLWGCHGFKPPRTLQDRKSDQMAADIWGSDSLAATWPEMSIRREDAWLSFTKSAAIRKVCRSIDQAVTEADHKDRSYLERKAVRANV